MTIILILVILIAIAVTVLSYKAGYSVGISVGYKVHRAIETGEIEEDFYEWLVKKEGVELDDTGDNHE